MKFVAFHLEYITNLLLLSGILFHPVSSFSFPFSSALTEAKVEKSEEVPINGSRGSYEITEEPDVLSDWSEKLGENALLQVKYLASKVAESTAESEEYEATQKDSMKVAGTGGVLFNNANFNQSKQKTGSDLLRPDFEISSNAKREDQVWKALANLEVDSE